MYIYGYINGGNMNPFRNFTITERLLLDIASIDEFKGRWAILGNLAP